MPILKRSCARQHFDTLLFQGSSSLSVFSTPFSPFMCLAACLGMCYLTSGEQHSSASKSTQESQLPLLLGCAWKESTVSRGARKNMAAKPLLQVLWGWHVGIPEEDLPTHVPVCPPVVYVKQPCFRQVPQPRPAWCHGRFCSWTQLNMEKLLPHASQSCIKTLLRVQLDLAVFCRGTQNTAWQSRVRGSSTDPLG